jgi:phosphate transport system substrate-binding protein
MHTASLARTLSSILVVLGMILSPMAAFAQGSPISIGGPLEGEAKALTGAGATFPAPLYQKWFDEYAKVTRVNINYQAIGSGGGIKGIQDQTVDFGASDAPMTDEQMQSAKGGPIFHIPTALGAIVPTYNVPEATNVQLNFTPDTLAAIYLGDIQSWNDPRLVADNPVLAGVDQPIVVVHRSDGSGTTFGFTDYLSSVSGDWQSQVGKGTSVNWPVGLGASGNPGVAGEVQQDAYAIGYVDVIYAIQNNLGYGAVQNSSGAFINPTLDSVTAAAASAVGSIPADLRFSIVNSPGPDAYPIATATWLLAYRDVSDRAKGLALTRMLWWATHEGQRFNNDLAFATVPDALTARSEQFIQQITVQGSPVFPNR